MLLYSGDPDAVDHAHGERYARDATSEEQNAGCGGDHTILDVTRVEEATVERDGDDDDVKKGGR